MTRSQKADQRMTARASRPAAFMLGSGLAPQRPGLVYVRAGQGRFAVLPPTG
jgi:hypothetical protein